ncbi:MAG: DUF1552 domain-containing protein, partial [Polyangiaceae bacterium]|nr:DUF1552 domain-containing protein [Polyangiaceae bacterium]
MRRVDMNRRRFLAAALGSAGLFVDARARGETPARSSNRPPLRFVGVYTPHGRAHELWRPKGGFDLRFEDSILRPFDDPDNPIARGKSYRDRLLVLDGIDLTAGIRVGTSGHDGARVILTGSGADGKGASLDQFLAATRDLGAETVHTSIVLGVGDAQTAIGQCVS